MLLTTLEWCEGRADHDCKIEHIPVNLAKGFEFEFEDNTGTTFSLFLKPAYNGSEKNSFTRTSVIIYLPIVWNVCFLTMLCCPDEIVYVFTEEVEPPSALLADYRSGRRQLGRYGFTIPAEIIKLSRPT